jgi:hypothetical protein
LQELGQALDAHRKQMMIVMVDAKKLHLLPTKCSAEEPIQISVGKLRGGKRRTKSARSARSARSKRSTKFTRSVRRRRSKKRSRNKYE